jgi:glutamate synthase (NADPH/NADH) large chain
LRIELEGDANDYVGKGLSGATIAIRPFGGCKEHRPGDAIIGNTVLYGATSGRVFAAGRGGPALCGAKLRRDRGGRRLRRQWL